MRCPECGEPVAKGQTHCFACGSDFVTSPVRSRFLQRNVIFFALIVSGCIIAVLLAILIAQPKAKRTTGEGVVTATKKTTGLVSSTTTTPRAGSKSVKPKITSPADIKSTIGGLSQELADLEEKITTLERIAQTENFTKDEKDALRFAQNLLTEMKALQSKIKDTRDEKETRRLIRQFRLKQNDINQFLFLLKHYTNKAGTR
uniref:Putative zinc-ribbon domain-containing protein n=1 Tax=candidate division WOR-3 bacterium TaxID=2052148 RepID=A0A7C6EB18_UNCW3